MQIKGVKYFERGTRIDGPKLIGPLGGRWLVGLTAQLFPKLRIYGNTFKAGSVTDFLSSLAKF